MRPLYKVTPPMPMSELNVRPLCKVTPPMPMSELNVRPLCKVYSTDANVRAKCETSM